MEQKKVSLLVSCVEMYARVVLGVGKGVLFREVSSFTSHLIEINGYIRMTDMYYVSMHIARMQPGLGCLTLMRSAIMCLLSEGIILPPNIRERPTA